MSFIASLLFRFTLMLSRAKRVSYVQIISTVALFFALLCRPMLEDQPHSRVCFREFPLEKISAYIELDSIMMDMTNGMLTEVDGFH